MSDHYLIVIPADLTFVPYTAAQQTAAHLAWRVFADAGEIAMHVTERIEFVYTLGNYEPPSCPLCGCDLDDWFWSALDQWAETMNASGLAVTLPCCGQPGSLNDLTYGDFPQGFARYQLSAMNANVDRIGAELIREFEDILGCPVRVVYRRV